MVKTWIADKLFPGLESYYQNLERFYDSRFLYPKTIYRPFYGIEELNDWEGRASSAEYAPYIKRIRSSPIGIDGLKDPYGGLELNYSGYVDLPSLIRAVRIFLKKEGLYQGEAFRYEALTISSTSVSYKEIEAEQVIFCEGPQSTANPYFGYLPFKPVKGEIVELETNLPEDIIINRGVFILPKNGFFSIGSTYDHSTLDFVPSEKGIKNLLDRLCKLYVGKSKVVNKSAGVRPATFDRKPFLGIHPEYHRLGIFNGFGTKGVSLVPYCTGLMKDHLLYRHDLPREVDIKRVNLS